MGVILSDTESHWGENWRGNKEGSEIEQWIATNCYKLDNDTVSAQVKDVFSSRVLLGWEDASQGRISIRWPTISTPENTKWIPGFLKILMNWSRACWSTWHQRLFGLRKDRYRLQQIRLRQHVNTWYTAPREEALIDKSKLPARELILRKINDAIAKWLDCRSEDRAKIMKT